MPVMSYLSQWTRVLQRWYFSMLINLGIFQTYQNFSDISYVISCWPYLSYAPILTCLTLSCCQNHWMETSASCTPPRALGVPDDVSPLLPPGGIEHLGGGVQSLRTLLSKIITRSPSRLTDAIQPPKGQNPALVCSHPETVLPPYAPEPGQYNPETDLSVRGSPR